MLHRTLQKAENRSRIANKLEAAGRLANAIRKCGLVLQSLAIADVQPRGVDYSLQLNRTDALPAFLRLSRTIWSWKNRAGRTVKLQLLPEAVATEIWKNHSSSTVWEYRLSSGIRETISWQKAYPRKKPYRLFLFVQVPDDTMSIEVKVAAGGKSWVSDATQFLMPVPLVPFVPE